MLQIPDIGFSVSTTSHNCNLGAFCDWIEGSLFFGNTTALSKADIIDVLVENQIYADNDFAYEFLADVWGILLQRSEAIGKCPYEIKDKRLEFKKSWRNHPAFGFCLVLSLTNWYSRWRETWSPGSNEQGALFEEITQHALQAIMPYWGIIPITQKLSGNNSFRNRVEKTAEILGILPGDLDGILTGKEKDGGLDLLCSFSSNDGRPEVPILLVQCASGNNWEHKLDEASPNYWRQLIPFASTPQKALSIPFVVTDRREFRTKTSRLEGWLLDRIRILSAGRYKTNWLPKHLQKRLCEWIAPRLKTLPISE